MKAWCFPAGLISVFRDYRKMDQGRVIPSAILLQKVFLKMRGVVLRKVLVR